MSPQVFVSVVVPTRKRARLLRRALESVIAQDLPSWEAIVVDDGDGEGIEVVAALGDERITAFPNEGRGVAEARATGIARARGQLICWLDDDDWWADPGHLSLLEREAAGPGFFFRGGWIVTETDDGRELGREVFDHDASATSLRRDNTVLTSSIAYPAELHERLGALDPGCGGYCDWDFMLRMCDAGIEPRKLPGLGVCYAVHDGNLSAAIAAPARLRSFEAFAAKHALDIVIANHVTIHRQMSIPEGWSEVEGALEREFRFDGFPAAVAFVNRVAELAEAEDHHPDIAISYDKVTLRFRTHSADAITDRDRDLARKAGDLADSGAGA